MLFQSYRDLLILSHDSAQPRMHEEPGLPVRVLGVCLVLTVTENPWVLDPYYDIYIESYGSVEYGSVEKIESPLS
jgi:hypothetical protein